MPPRFASSRRSWLRSRRTVAQIDCAVSQGRRSRLRQDVHSPLNSTRLVNVTTPIVLPWPLQSSLEAMTRVLCLNPASHIDFSRPVGEAALLSPESVSWGVVSSQHSIREIWRPPGSSLRCCCSLFERAVCCGALGNSDSARAGGRGSQRPSPPFTKAVTKRTREGVLLAQSSSLGNQGMRAERKHGILI